MNSNKTLAVSLMIAFLLITPVAHSQNAVNCPSKLVLNNAQFLGGASFPTRAQVETNFNQVFREAFTHIVLWEPSDLNATWSFVQIIEKNYKSLHDPKSPSSAALILPLGLSQGICGGKIGNLNYTYDGEEVSFVSPDQNQRVWFHIPLSSPAPVIMELPLPSNCSNCPRETELFQFKGSSTL